MAFRSFKPRKPCAGWFLAVLVSAAVTLSVFRAFAEFSELENKEASLVVSKDLSVFLELNRLVYVKADDRDLQLVFDPASQKASGAKDYCVKVNYTPLEVDFRVDSTSGSGTGFQLVNGTDDSRLNIDVGVENVISGATGDSKPVTPGANQALAVGGSDFDCGGKNTTRLNVTSDLARQNYSAGIYRTTLKLTFAAK